MPIVLANEHIALTFQESDPPGSLVLHAVENRVTGRRVRFAATTGVALTLDGVTEAVGQQSHGVRSTDLNEARGTLTLSLDHAASGLVVEQEVALHGPVARLRLRVRNEGTAPRTLRDVTFLEAQLSELARQGHTDVRLDRGDPGDVTVGRSHGAFDANPIFVGDDLFLGVDWPVAENACRESYIVCRHFPGQELAPGQEWVSRTFSIGVAAPGAVTRAFMDHLNALRGRPTRRAAFYFDWLLHASEGPTEAQTMATLDFLALLRERWDVRFDIYAVDDGAVETRWELMWDRYRPRHDTLFPHGLSRCVQRARELGMGFGVWLGPDVVYPGDATGARREEDITRMVRDWNIHLIKLDTCVSWPLTGDPYFNDRYMSRLAALYAACRAINPDLVVINHRIRFSPYMLTVLDSTLWEGAESYPEVFLGNGHTPRLHTRYAAYARQEPTYYGTYSPLLEDHGICFNGDWRGWREEFVLGAFGRALALSPEVYGTLFLLPDQEYPELGRLMRLARENRALLATTVFLPESGDFLHSDGRRALRCLINDSWRTTTRVLRPERDFGLTAPSASTMYSVYLHYPQAGEAPDLQYGVGDEIVQPLLPFGVAVLEVRVAEPTIRATARAGRGTPATRPQTEELATLRALSGEEMGALAVVGALEATRFAVNDDTPELQALAAVGRSTFSIVQDCRAWYRDKQRREVVGISANAWDGDPWTAWGDEFFWAHTSNIWRLDLGDARPIHRLEITLSQRQPGPVRRDAAGERGFTLPVHVQASADLLHWQTTEAHVYHMRTPSGDSYLQAFIAEFPPGTLARYLRILNRGFWAQDITIRAPSGEPLPRDAWRGNNTLTERSPLAVYSGAVTLPHDTSARTLATICRLGEQVTVDPNTEVALAWVRHGERVIPLVEASPLLPSHRWEHYAQVPGNNVVFRLPLTADLASQTLQISVALFTPEHVREGWITTYAPDVRVLCVPEAYPSLGSSPTLRP